jgi:hypothetical protein
MKLDDLSLYTILQILSVTLFEKEQLLQVFDHSRYNILTTTQSKQLKLFDY